MVKLFLLLIILIIEAYSQPEENKIFSQDKEEFPSSNSKHDFTEEIFHKDKESEKLISSSDFFLIEESTNLFLKCHENCLTCEQEPIKNDLGYITSMECTKCKDWNNMNKKMIKVNNNCFEIIQYENTKIVFDISPINPNNKFGNCKYFDKAIYYNEYECIDRPDNTYYVLTGDENTGVIKDCPENFGENDFLDCKSNTETIITETKIEITEKKSINSDTWKNTNETNEIKETENTTEGKEQSSETINTNNTNDLIECDMACSTCIKPKEENNTNCQQCNTADKYYPLYESPSYCYNEENSFIQNYYLDKSESLFSWKKCYEKCETCKAEGNSEKMNCLSCKTNLDSNADYEIQLVASNCVKVCLNNKFLTPNGNCEETCPDGTYQYPIDSSCRESCPDNYKIYNNKCIIETFDKNIKLEEFKTQIRENILAYVEPNKIINCTNFLALIYPSKDMEPKAQLENGISAFDLGNCTSILKEHYSIPENEDLIIMNIEVNNNNKQSENSQKYNTPFIFEKSSQIEIFDSTGRKLNLSFCEDDITIMKNIKDEEKLDLNSAKAFSDKGIDVFNAGDDFFYDICKYYDNSGDKDIMIEDRRDYVYQNATFCQDGCTYDGINTDLIVANCICKSNIFDEDKTNTIEINDDTELKNFKTYKAPFDDLVYINLKVMRCHNLVLNTKILFHNLGFYLMFIMFILQIIFFCAFLVNRFDSIKSLMLKFGNKAANKGNIKNNNVNVFNNKKRFNNNTNNQKFVKKGIIASPPIKKNNIQSFNNFNKRINNPNVQSFSKSNLMKNSNVPPNLRNNIRIHNIYNRNNIQINNNFNIKQNNKNKKLPPKAAQNKLFRSVYDLQELDYEDALIYDNREYFGIYWRFLVDSQIFLSTFCTDNNLDLLTIKLSFFIFTLQVCIFFNAFFYTDEYISYAYHKGRLDFLYGLPKSIFASFATLVITNFLSMFISSKKELMTLIKEKRNVNNYPYLIHFKLIKFGKKLIFYFIMVLIISLFFLYYVIAFCAVYRNSQKYIIIGCIASLGFKLFISVIICVFLAHFRYMSIRKHIKCLFSLSKFVRAIL